MTTETQIYFNSIIGLCFVIGLIFLCAYIARKYGVHAATGRQAAGRIAVVASRSLDVKNRLVLIRKDDKEHLILISPQGVQVIETSEAKKEEEHGEKNV